MNAKIWGPSSFFVRGGMLALASFVCLIVFAGANDMYLSLVNDPLMRESASPNGLMLLSIGGLLGCLASGVGSLIYFGGGIVRFFAFNVAGSR